MKQDANSQSSAIADAQILSIKDTGKTNQQNHAKITSVTLKVLSGKYQGKTMSFEDNMVALPYHISFKQGDHVVATISDNGNNTQMVYVSDYNRQPQLLTLFAFFLIVTILIARKQAITSFIGMLISIYVIA